MKKKDRGEERNYVVLSRVDLQRQKTFDQIFNRMMKKNMKEV